MATGSGRSSSGVIKKPKNTNNKTSSSTSKTSSTSSVHQYVSTTPSNVPGNYKQSSVKSSTLNKGIPNTYKAQPVTADTYKGPTYQADPYKSDYKLGSYDSKYMPDIEQRTQNLANWSYNPLQDASYQALAQVYGARGNLAAKNSLADAAALNGGYGTSYAVSAAQQARNQYNQELMSLVPELEQAAYNRAATGLNALMDLDQTQYGRYRDTEADKQWLEQNNQNVWSMNREDAYRAIQNAMDIHNIDTAARQWANEFNQGERQFAYNSGWDRYNTILGNRKYANDYNQSERQFGANYGLDRANLLNSYFQWATDKNDSLYEWQLAQAKAGGSGGGSGGGGRSGGGGSGSGYTGDSSGDSGMPISEEDFNKLKGRPEYFTNADAQDAYYKGKKTSNYR